MNQGTTGTAETAVTAASAMKGIYGSHDQRVPIFWLSMGMRIPGQQVFSYGQKAYSDDNNLMASVC